METVQTNVYLPRELDEFIETLVSKGIFASKSEASRIVWLIIRENFSEDQLRSIATQAKLFGSQGVKVA